MINFIRNVGIHPSPRVSVGYGAGGGHALVASGVSSSSVAPVTLNTTGATLLVAIVGANLATPGMSDSVGGNTNSWTGLTQATGSANQSEIFYAFAKTGGGPLQTGASHVFTPAGTAASCAVYAFSGTLTTSSVFDSANQSSGNASGSPTTFQPGSITPTAGDLVVCGFSNNGTTNTGTSINNSFTGVLLQTSGASFEIMAGAYLLSAAAAPLNPTWTTNATTTSACMIACFK